MVICGTERSVIRDVLMDRINLRIRAPEDRIAQSVGGNFDLRWTAKKLSDAIFKHDIPALYATHFQGLTIRGFDLGWAANLPDYFSSAIECEDFKDLDIADFDGRQAPAAGSAPAIALQRGDGVSIRDSRAEEGTSTFLSLSKVGEQRLFVNNDLSKARLDISVASGKPAFKQYGNIWRNSQLHRNFQ